MKDPHPWICDICKVHKLESNHWLLGGEFRSEKPDLPPPEAGFFIEPWREKFAEEDYQTIKVLSHLCGVECVQKWVTQRLGKIYEQAIAREKIAASSTA